VDPENDEVYFTPIFYTLTHFSKYIRPGAERIGFTNSDEALMVTAAKNPDGSIAVVVFNQGAEAKSFNLSMNESTIDIQISGQAIQTILIPNS
jgi:glucosylceramidase